MKILLVLTVAFWVAVGVAIGFTPAAIDTKAQILITGIIIVLAVAYGGVLWKPNPRKVEKRRASIQLYGNLDTRFCGGMDELMQTHATIKRTRNKS